MQLRTCLSCLAMLLCWGAPPASSQTPAKEKVHVITVAAQNPTAEQKGRLSEFAVKVYPAPLCFRVTGRDWQTPTDLYAQRGPGDLSPPDLYGELKNRRDDWPAGRTSFSREFRLSEIEEAIPEEDRAEFRRACSGRQKGSQSGFDVGFLLTMAHRFPLPGGERHFDGTWIYFRLGTFDRSATRTDRDTGITFRISHSLEYK